ncbi:O-antigen ligase family protein [Blautia sp. CLA-JM-H16]|uniref:O-antigen ligase family protein n=1 Tax=Blautia aquisgranensis TaxID=3133153 RepID=A0ABV1BI92_9FIRM
MKISKFSLKYFVMMAIIIYPIGYFYFAPYLRSIYRYGKWVVIAYGILLMVKRVYNPSKIVSLIIALEVYLGIITIVRGGNISTWMNYALPNIAMAFLVDFGIKKKPKVAIKAVALIGMFHLLINNLLGYVSSNGMNWYWLGLRVRIASYAFPVIAVLMIALFYFKKSRKCKIIWLISFLVSLLASIQFFLKEQVATALVTLGAFVIYFLLFCFMEKLTSKFAPKAWCVEIVINIGIVFFGIQSKFAWLIEGILGKSLTFTGRTTIWNSAFGQAMEHCIFGSGIGTARVFNDNGVTYEHNQLLNMFYTGGLIALMLFLIILFISIKRVCDTKRSILNKIMASILLACSIEMITEHPFENALFISVLVIAYHSTWIHEILEDGNGDNKKCSENLLLQDKI